MLERLVWNGLGIVCCAGIAALGRRIFKQAPLLTFRVLAVSFFVGLFSGSLGVIGFFIFSLFKINYFMWMTDIEYEARLCVTFFFFLFSGFVSGKVGAYLFKKYLSDTVVLSAALIAALLLIFQPIGYGWLRLIGIL